LRPARDEIIVSLSHLLMNGYGHSEEHQPVTWWRGYPLYATHFLVAVFTASLLVTTLMMFFRVDPLLDWLSFSSGEVLRGQVWRIATYGLVNPPSLQFVIDMLMFVWFGREVEKFFGRRKFFLLYGCIYLVTPVLFTAIGLWLPLARAGETGAFALFVAFATLYPNALLMFDVLAKVAAGVLVAIFTLMALAYHDWTGLISLWATSGFAFLFVRIEQGLITLPRFRWPRRKPNLRVLPDLPATKRVEAVTSEGASMSEIDALLDKIAHSGIGSLTAKERARLEKGREHLLKKESGRR
jgi:membrane associated rhomboid family serine protease